MAKQQRLELCFDNLALNFPNQFYLDLAEIKIFWRKIDYKFAKHWGYAKIEKCAEQKYERQV